MFRLILLLLTTISLFVACGGGETTTTAETTTPAAAAVAPQVQLKPAYPSIPIEKAQNLFDNCDYVDYIFYYTNFSISQKDQASIQQSIGHIASTAPPGLNPTCKPIGKIYYQIKGENVSEADFYFQDDCKYLIFLEDGKPAYSNLLTQPGINYFNNIFAQVQGQGAQ